MPEIDFLPYIIAFVQGFILGASIYLEERSLIDSRNEDKDDQDKDDEDDDSCEI